MTMRRPAAFMAVRSRTERGRDSAFMRTQLRELPLPEITLRQAGMGDGQVGLGYPQVAVQNDIEIEGPRRPPGPDLPHPARRPLDALADVEQRARREGRAQERHLVEVRRLVHAAQGSGLLLGAHGEELGP